MKVVLIGLGKIGSILTEYLIKEKIDVTVVDIDQQKVEEAVNKYDVNGLVGIGIEKETLITSEAVNADYFIATTSRDEFNILACSLAKKSGAKFTLARVRTPVYYQQEDTLKKDLGVDLMFNPEYLTAREISNLLKFPSALSVENFASGEAKLVKLKLKEDNPLVGKTVKEINQEYNNEKEKKVLFGLIERENEIIIPFGDTIFNANDILSIIGNEKDIGYFCKQTKLFKNRAKNIFILGGGNISYYLAQDLDPSNNNGKILDNINTSVKILEINEERCQQLSVDLPKATILCGDATDTDILDEEQLKLCDACVSLTGNDEENVISSLYAIKEGVKKVVTKVDKLSIKKIVNSIGLDTIVSPSDAISGYILGVVRGDNTKRQMGEGLKRIFKVNEKAEVIEFIIGQGFKMRGEALRENKVKHGCLIGGIVRNGKFIVPTGDDSLQTGDRILVVTTLNKITEIEQIFRR